MAIKEKQWSIRQAAFHHQFDVIEGTTLWIVTKGNFDIKDRVQDMTGKGGRPEDRAFASTAQCFKSSLAAHLLFCHWSTEEWRWYVQWLEDVVEQLTYIAIQGPRGPDEAQRVYTSGDLQTVQTYEDKTNEAIMIQEANVDVLASLCKFYLALLENSDFPLKDVCFEDIITFSTQVNDMIYDSKMQISRAKLLVRITSGRKALHLQSQATENMEALTMSMRKIGVMSQKEAIIMRIITVVTLIYLPGTFVSTLFSTDIVKYQNLSDSSLGGASLGNKTSRSTFSKVALFRWLQVTLPLTVVTLALGLVFFKIAYRRRKREGLALDWA